MPAGDRDRDVAAIIESCWMRYSPCKKTTLELVHRLGYEIDEARSVQELIAKMVDAREERLQGLPKAQRRDVATRQALQDLMLIVDTLLMLFPGLE